jgi:hypothetical protein
MMDSIENITKSIRLYTELWYFEARPFRIKLLRKEKTSNKSSPINVEMIRGREPKLIVYAAAPMEFPQSEKGRAEQL